MQQYFVDQELSEGISIALNNEILYHLIKVLRKDTSYIFRIADAKGQIFHAHLLDKKNALVTEALDENNELDCKITCILSLIKSDKFELCIQKLVELGVHKIVPYNAKRSIMKIKDLKKMERIRKIAREAAEQSHRNIIPEIVDPISLSGLKEHMSEANYICYEAEGNIADIERSASVSYIIGPEGGFAKEEHEAIEALGFHSISLGKRILRAETAAIYMTSIIVGKHQ
ncbi:MAG: 16S rRNA (uracil(1498)-N(3))-methyltransferase [Erysipelotrichaceae bacterium]|nr:16S rRNA (uracil(1498)-N(3))-methyltransferase [Erysipelotrichaceae bacterium]